MQLGPFVKQITCVTDESYIGFGILIGYRIVLCIIGCVLALQNRKINIPELRESRQVGLATYVFLFVVIVEVATVLAVQDSRIRAILLTLEVQAATTFLLLILFVPKVCWITISNARKFYYAYIISETYMCLYEYTNVNGVMLRTVCIKLHTFVCMHLACAIHSHALCWLHKTEFKWHSVCNIHVW